jgi:hypothetical protein
MDGHYPLKTDNSKDKFYTAYAGRSGRVNIEHLAAGGWGDSPAAVQGYPKINYAF